MRKHARSHNVASDASEYVDAWAGDIVAALSKSDVRRLLSDYKAIAGNARLAKSDRETAAARADALEQLL